MNKITGTIIADARGRAVARTVQPLVGHSGLEGKP